jgi:hypothetical protein
MEISKNIIYDSEAIKDSEFKFHTKQLEIVSLNLDDFNLRLNSNIKLHYNHIWNVFLLESKNEIYGDVFSRHISHCLAFFNDENWSEGMFIYRDLYNIKNVMINLLYHIKDNVESFKNNDVLMSELNLFLKRFSNYHPLGILTQSGEAFYKEESQKIVNELNSVLYLLD